MVDVQTVDPDSDPLRGMFLCADGIRIFADFVPLREERVSHSREITVYRVTISAEGRPETIEITIDVETHLGSLDSSHHFRLAYGLRYEEALRTWADKWRSVVLGE